MYFRIFTLLLLCSAVSGCASRYSDVIQVTPEQSNEQLFTCVNQTISEISFNWNRDVFEKNLDLGTLDVGNYQSSESILGYRLKVIRANKRLKLYLKGVGLYYTDPGVDEEMEKLKKGIKSCIQYGPKSKEKSIKT